MSEAPRILPDRERLTSCQRCGTEIADSLLCCPSCQWLIHGESLKALASEAEAAGRDGDWLTARDAWRRASELLPPESAQLSAVLTRIDEIGRRMESEGTDAYRQRSLALDETRAAEPGTPSPVEHDHATRSKVTGIAAAAAGAALLLWKFKFVLGFLATKGKLLLLGLTKGSTVFSMLLSLGLYWSLFGWMFGAGLVLSIYVHEIGHVAALRRLGIRASAPMFIPGFGAMVRLKQYPASPREDARVGLAGPIWGLGASLFCLAAYHATGLPILGAIARVGAWLNLFNLIPVWQLDGSRGLRALSRVQRWSIVGAAAVVGALAQESLFLLIVLAAGWRSLKDVAPAEGDARSFGEFVLLLAGLGALCALEVPGVG